MYTRNLKCNAKPSESNAAGASRETSLSHAAPVDPAVKKSGIMLNPEKAASQSHVSVLCTFLSNIVTASRARSPLPVWCPVLLVCVRDLTTQRAAGPHLELVPQPRTQLRHGQSHHRACAPCRLAGQQAQPAERAVFGGQLVHVDVHDGVLAVRIASVAFLLVPLLPRLHFDRGARQDRFVFGIGRERRRVGLRRRDQRGPPRGEGLAREGGGAGGISV